MDKRTNCHELGYGLQRKIKLTQAIEIIIMKTVEITIMRAAGIIQMMATGYHTTKDGRNQKEKGGDMTA